MDKIRISGHLKIWTLSSDSNEYERYARLLNGSAKHSLSAEQLNSSLLAQGSSALAGSKSIVVVHDPSPILKAESSEMEGLSRVLDLDRNVVNGYESFNSIAIGNQGRLHLLGAVVSEQDAQRKAAYQAQVSAISEGLRKADEDAVLIHNMDRGFDDQDYFRLIDKELRDKFVIRLKLNRNSGLDKWDSERGREVSQKLKEADFSAKSEKVLDKFSWGKKLYTQAKVILEWGSFYLGDDFYNVVRITLKDRKGNRIFKNPMLLVSNLSVRSESVAFHIFQIYLKRAKIEGVFKFLKEHLGWDSFQVRKFKAIQNLIVLAYFIGGYFYEIEDELIQNEWMRQVCVLGGGKGKATKVFFLRGLAKLAHYQEIKKFMEDNKLTEEQVTQLFQQIE